MLIIVPTFKRIDRLKWTLISLLMNSIPKIDESLRIVIANNYPPSTVKVQTLVDSIRKEYSSIDFWKWNIIHRERTLDPAENCLSVISKYAVQDEVVIVQGDDDLFTPWSLSNRSESIVKASSEVLISKSKYSLWYLDESGRIYLADDVPVFKSTNEAYEIDWADIYDWGAIFLGNNCYRYTKRFQKAIDLMYDWFSQQDWLDFNTKSLMWPFYLPYAVKVCGGKVHGIDQFNVIRGNLLKERTNDPFEVSFNTGLISLCAYGVLNNKDLKPIRAMDRVRNSLEEYISEWLIPLYLDKRVKKQIRKATFENVDYTFKKIKLKGLVKGVKRTIKNYLGVQLLFTRIRASKSNLTIYELLDKMNEKTN